MNRADDILNSIAARKSSGEPFALATVVRTVAATAAKAGAKAVILRDGTISEGWIGGDCARAAVLKAARRSASANAACSAEGAQMVTANPERRAKSAIATATGLDPQITT
jgi:xanthine/CO dehydrogenase XdhC/CoxF family maturation factor